MSGLDTELELTPPQPPDVAAALAAALAADAAPADPWWQAGLDEALGENGHD